MNEREESLIDQSPLTESVSEKIKYTFKDKFLIKPLDSIKVKKEVSKPVIKDDKPVADRNGIEAVDYQDVETETVEVDSDFRKGVVLKVPYSYAIRMNDEKWPEFPVHVGDVVIYNNNSAKWFDLLKDTVLVDHYSIFAKEDTVIVDE